MKHPLIISQEHIYQDSRTNAVSGTYAPKYLWTNMTSMSSIIINSINTELESGGCLHNGKPPQAI